MIRRRNRQDCLDHDADDWVKVMISHSHLASARWNARARLLVAVSTAFGLETVETVNQIRAPRVHLAEARCE